MKDYKKYNDQLFSRWAPVYDEIYVYKNIIPASAKDLETETTKMSPNN